MTSVPVDSKINSNNTLNNVDSTSEANTISMSPLNLNHDQSDDPYMGYASLEDSRNDCVLNSQAEVLARLLNGENLFISGFAGSGKTTVINRFKSIIERDFPHVSIAITASTGIAATLIGGVTIHSWSGIGIDTTPFDAKNLPRTFWSKRKIIETTDVLIIDEISMLPAYFFTKLDHILRTAKRSNKPFGGIQIVLIGDFLQLPPVDKNKQLKAQGLEEVDNRFCIETKSWQDLNVRCCFMDHTHRATDERLKKLLWEIANNKVTDYSRKIIEDKLKSSQEDPNKVYTTLFTTNMNVDKYNEDRHNANPKVAQKYSMSVISAKTPKDKDAAIKYYSIQPVLSFKIDDIVILTKNISDENGVIIANGSVGKVISMTNYGVTVRFNNGITRLIGSSTYNYTTVKMTEYTNPTTKKIEKRQNEEILAIIQQLPLRLGYAITVHKSQGQTFDGVRVDLSKCFVDGLGYVALSRVRSLDDLIITGFSERAFKVDKRSCQITKYVKKCAKDSRDNFTLDENHFEQLLLTKMMRMTVWADKEFDGEERELQKIADREKLIGF